MHTTEQAVDKNDKWMLKADVEIHHILEKKIKLGLNFIKRLV